MEALVAMLLSSLIIMMVSGVFVAQNRSYQAQIGVVDAHHNARAVTELLSNELRLVPKGGVVEAKNDRITIRTPITMMVACSTGNSGVNVHLDGGLAGLDTTAIAGVASRDWTTGEWTYGEADWSDLRSGGGTPASDCADEGADTTSASSDYYRFDYTGFSELGSGPFDGDLLMLYSETTFQFQTSLLDPTTVGLFRQVNGGELVEFATGMDASAQFLYRSIGATSYQTSKSSKGGTVKDVDAVRLISEATGPALPGIEGQIHFGWSVNVALRNAR